MLTLLALIGCKDGTLTALPAEVAWGEIDFSQPAPSDGYDPQRVTECYSCKK